jgi:DNA-binding beta-propeller fold protein YncE
MGSADTPAASPAPLVLAQTVPVSGGAGHFDFMQPDRRAGRIYASHPGKGTLVVLDLKTHTVQQIDTNGEINGIVVDRADNKLFACGGNQKIEVFNHDTLAKTDEISLTGPADDLVLDTKTDTLYVDHDDGTEAWVVDAKTDKLTGSVTLAGAPEVVAYDSTSDKLYQNIKPANEIQVIDPATNKVVSTWPTAPMESPHGLVVDSRNNRIFDAGNGKVDVIDLQSGKVLQTIDIAQGYVDQIAFDRSQNRLYCASSVGALSVIDTSGDKVSLLGIVTVPKGTHTLAVDPTDHGVWVSCYDDTSSFLQEYKAPGAPQTAATPSQ